jgi:hypothetical protein
MLKQKSVKTEQKKDNELSLKQKQQIKTYRKEDI